jgi:putative membrane protein
LVLFSKKELLSSFVFLLSQRVQTRPIMLRALAAILLLGSLSATALMIVWSGAQGVGDAMWRGLPALPPALAVHAAQLGISGYGWWLLLPRKRPRRSTLLLTRWVRESLNTALPLAGIGGGVAATRLLARDAGLSMAQATAATAGDLTCEAIAQAPYLIAALAVVALLAPGALTPARAVLAVLPIALAAAAFVAAQRLGLMRLIERATRRFGFGTAMEGLHDALMALHARPADVTRAITLHTLSWSLGGAEVWVILNAIGHPVGPGAAFAIEGLGMAARSLGFALPSGLAAQEAGFVVACAAFGVPANDAVALSLVKRLRELIVATAGIGAWRLALRRPVAP